MPTTPGTGDSEADSGEDPQYWLSYRLPEDVDPRARAWPAQVDRATWDRARATGEVRVRVLPDDPAAATVEGEVVRRAGLWSTLVVDAVLLGLVLLWWRYRRRRPAAGEGSEDGPEPDEGPRDGPAGGQASSSW